MVSATYKEVSFAIKYGYSKLLVSIISFEEMFVNCIAMCNTGEQIELTGSNCIMIYLQLTGNNPTTTIGRLYASLFAPGEIPLLCA